MADVDEMVLRRAKFVAFVASKVGDRALAEDLVQDAFARLDEHVRDGEAWLYRVLRNAVIDRARRERTRARALEAFARELPVAEGGEACRCVHAAKDALKPTYREALDRVELAGVALKDYASEAGISANSAAVRVHRARHALRERVSQTCSRCQGCFDCDC
jgi:RNA polymerase sigma factor (sigma-70 family)